MHIEKGRSVNLSIFVQEFILLHSLQNSNVSFGGRLDKVLYTQVLGIHNRPHIKSNDMDVFAPLVSPLPPPLEGDVLTESQWETLMAIGDTLIPFIEVSSTTPSFNKLSVKSSEYAAAIESLKRPLADQTDLKVPQQYLEEHPSSLPGFKQSLQRTLGENLREGALKGFRIILSALKYRQMQNVPSS